MPETSQNTSVTYSLRRFIAALLFPDEISPDPIPELLGAEPGSVSLTLADVGTLKTNDTSMLDGASLRTADYEVSIRGQRTSAISALLSDGEPEALVRLEDLAGKLSARRIRPDIDIGEECTPLRLDVLTQPTAVSVSGAALRYALRFRLTYLSA